LEHNPNTLSAFLNTEDEAMKSIVTIRNHVDDSFTEPYVEVTLITAHGLQKFSEAQTDALPDEFRCYSCLQVHKKRDIGGILREQRICKFCYPWLDEWSVGMVIKFDLAHRQPVKGYMAPEYHPKPEHHTIRGFDIPMDGKEAFDNYIHYTENEFIELTVFWLLVRN
jgi:hypothetical protein